MRYVDDYSGGTNAWSHTHHHHHHKNSKKLKDDNDSHDDVQSKSSNGEDRTATENSSEENVLDEGSHDSFKEDIKHESHIRKVIYLCQKNDRLFSATCSHNFCFGCCLDIADLNPE